MLAVLRQRIPLAAYSALPPYTQLRMYVGSTCPVQPSTNAAGHSGPPNRPNRPTGPTAVAQTAVAEALPPGSNRKTGRLPPCPALPHRCHKPRDTQLHNRTTAHAPRAAACPSTGRRTCTTPQRGGSPPCPPWGPHAPPYTTPAAASSRLEGLARQGCVSAPLAWAWADGPHWHSHWHSHLPRARSPAVRGARASRCARPCPLWAGQSALAGPRLQARGRARREGPLARPYSPPSARPLCIMPQAGGVTPVKAWQCQGALRGVLRGTLARGVTPAARGVSGRVINSRRRRGVFCGARVGWAAGASA